jgi:membrane protease YdiL (CAAX protease family)
VIGGLWPPGSLGYPLGPINLGEVTPSTALIFSLAAELLFRGVILGNLAARLPTQKSGDPWWISWPTLISSLLYAMASLLVFLSFSNGQLLWSQCFATLAGALIFGIASGAARERSESILAPVLFHWFCAAVLRLSGSFMF